MNATARKIGATAAQTAMSMAGGGVYYGMHALITPSVYGTDAANIPKRCWWIPVLGVVGGNFLSMIPKVGSIGHGVAGGATAIGIEQVQMAVSIVKNRKASGTSGVGALLDPSRDQRQLPAAQPRAEAGYTEETEAGALWTSPQLRELAGLSL